MDYPYPDAPEIQCPEVEVILTHFLRQVQSHHARTATQQPTPLHWNASFRSLEQFGWPVSEKTATRIPPGEWESLRRTHQFRAPCCLCAFLDGREYTESRIGISEILSQPSDGEGSLVVGEYVATCAERRCGFLLCIERFHLCDGIKLKVYPERASPLPVINLAHVSDIDKTYRKPDGLFQVMSKASVRGKGGRLVLLNPEEMEAPAADLLRELSCGISEARFWATFVQCIVCMNVMLRGTMMNNHQCKGRCDSQQRLPHLDSHRPRRVQARFDSMRGDVPEERVLYSLRPNSPAPTELIGGDGSDY